MYALSLNGYLFVLFRAIGQQNTFALHMFVYDTLKCGHVALYHILNLNTW